MHVAFHSSHVDGDYSDGKLHLRVDPERGPDEPSRVDALWFTVPPDFHTHNDSVAAALLTLVGRRFQHVTLNFPISRFCAETLTWYYQLDEVGPVDDTLEPRRPGRFLALNFSGGLDSTAIWVLLRELARVTFKVVTSEYEHSVLDRPGFSAYHRDVSSLTNLRRLRYDRDGRFNCAAPLLFADYADLWGVASGHLINHRPHSFENLSSGAPAAFLAQDATYNAGGLAEVHIGRALTEPGVLRLLAEQAPERIAAALDASAHLIDRKRAIKSLTLEYYFVRAGLPRPECLIGFPVPPPGKGRSTAFGVGFRTIWLYKCLSRETMARIEPRIYETDLSMIAETSVGFYERYHTGCSLLIPAPLRAPVLQGLHAAGIYPYAERDYRDLESIRQYLETVDVDAAASSLRRADPPPACWSPSAFDPARLLL